jgi:hypothetical protein
MSAFGNVLTGIGNFLGSETGGAIIQAGLGLLTNGNNNGPTVYVPVVQPTNFAENPISQASNAAFQSSPNPVTYQFSNAPPNKNLIYYIGGGIILLFGFIYLILKRKR